MLAKYISRPLLGLTRSRFAFSAGHHDSHDSHDGHHHHHDYSVAIDKETPWVKYRTNPKLVCIEGLEETNYGLQPRDTSDPFEHIRKNPFLSFERLVFTDPWYHEDSHEIYNSAPERGYINGEDPLETRYLYTVPILTAVGLITLAVTLYSFADLRMANSEALVYSEKVARDYVHEQLNAKNAQLNQLRAKEAELLAATQ